MNGPPRALVGTIPAGAGSRNDAPPGGPICWDHPRTRGEQRLPLSDDLDDEGPSPQVPGADYREGGPVRGPPGHPRGCGEQLSALGTDGSTMGPSPRVRGAVFLTCSVTAGKRDSRALSPNPTYQPSALSCRDDKAIPSTRRTVLVPPGRGGPPSLLRHHGDHPRGCGEQLPQEERDLLPLGPSPRVRGAGPARGALDVLRGTIPHARGASPGCGREDRGAGTIPARAGRSGRSRRAPG